MLPSVVKFQMLGVKQGNLGIENEYRGSFHTPLVKYVDLVSNSWYMFFLCYNML